MQKPSIYDHVPTLEWCKKLKEAGFDQNTVHCWVKVGEEMRIVSWQWLELNHVECEVICAAPMIQEIEFYREIDINNEAKYWIAGKKGITLKGMIDYLLDETN